MPLIPLLFRIQEIEIQLLTLNQRNSQLDQDPNLLALEDLFKATEKQINRLNLELMQTRSRIKQIETELKSYTDHVAQEEQRLYSGKISNPRELEQIQQKITENRQAQTKLEDELYPLLEKEETLSKQLSQQTKRMEETSLEIERVQKRIREQKLEIQLEVTDFQTEMESLLPQIPSEWMERYRKIASSHKGIGMAKLKNNACGACHVSQSDSLLQKIKRGEDKLFFCENCGRILCF